MTRSVLRKESSGSVRVFWLVRQLALASALEACRRVLDGREEVVRAGVFGSIARGNAVPGSDLDILIVAESDSVRGVRPFDRAGPYLPYFEGIGLPVEVFCYAVGETAGRAFFGRNASGARWMERPTGPAPASGPPAGPP